MARKNFIALRLNDKERAPLTALSEETGIAESELARELVKRALKLGKV